MTPNRSWAAWSIVSRAAAVGDQRLVPGHGRLAGVPVERDEVGLLALVEVAEQVVEVEAFGAAERGEVEAAVGLELVALGLGQVLLAGVDRAVEHGVVAHADLVGLFQHADACRRRCRRPCRCRATCGPRCSGSVARPRRNRPLPRNRFDSGQNATAAPAFEKPAELVVRRARRRGRPVNFGPSRPCFSWTASVVVRSRGSARRHVADLGRVLGDVRVDPAVRVLLLELPAASIISGGAADGEARRDRVEVAALAVILLDQPLAVAIEVLGRDRRSRPARSGRCRSGRRSRACCGGPPRRRALRSRPGCCVVKAWQVVVPPASRASKKRSAAVARVVAVAVLQLLGEDPVLEPVEQLLADRRRARGSAGNGCGRR